MASVNNSISPDFVLDLKPRIEQLNSTASPRFFLEELSSGSGWLNVTFHTDSPKS
jgi:hypothetical protein